MGIYLHFKLTEYFYIKKYSPSYNWDDILQRHYHQVILLKPPMRPLGLGLIRQCEDSKLRRPDYLSVVLQQPAARNDENQFRTDQLLLRLPNPQY